MGEVFTSAAATVLRDVLARVDRKIYQRELTPTHGPGATADKLFGNEKWLHTEYSTRLNHVFPWEDWFSPSYLDAFERLNEGSVHFRDPGDEVPVKVLGVPKNMKTLRIIAEEPSYVMYMQKALQQLLYDEIEKDDLLSNFIGFTDQTPNQEMAREGSFYGTLATIDLKDASDRVSNQLVRALSKNHPHLFEALDATRSRKADVPGHGIIRLAKYASMGSALCFPLEAMVFCTIVFMALSEAASVPLTRSFIKSMVGRVRVYGDDLIVPNEYATSVVSRLEDFGLRVNAGKSFWTGKFRESCGRDYYDGYDVSIVKIRRVFPTQRQHTSELVSTVSLRNQLYLAGFRSTVDKLDRMIEKLIPFPYVLPTSAALGRFREEGHQTDFWDSDLQRPMVKAAVTEGKPPVSQLDGYPALLKSLLHKGEPLAEDHLERAGRPNSVYTKVRWTSAL